MKKKGLIISTIVMVVVLIASLTTATYAWFTQNASAQVETINLKVDAASDVIIGLRSKAASGADVQSNFVSGSVTYNNGTKFWTGQAGLGASLNTGIPMNVSEGVGSGQAGQYSYTAKTQAELLSEEYIEDVANSLVWKGTKYSATGTQLYTRTINENVPVYTAVTSGDYSSSTTYFVRSAETGNAMDYSYNLAEGHSLMKAAGESFETLGTPSLAVINSTTGADVIELDMAIKPVKPDIYGTYCVITITPTTEFVGMAAALWADISVGSKKVTGYDLFDKGEAQENNQIHYATSAVNNNEQIAYKFYFDIDALSGTQISTSGTSVTSFFIRLFVSGYDEDCVTNATGTGATIDIKFFGMTSAGYQASGDGDITDAHKIALV